MFSLPLRATAHIPELEVEKNKSTKKSFKPRQTPIAVYPTLRSMLVLMDVFRAEEKKKAMEPKRRAENPTAKICLLLHVEKCCECYSECRRNPVRRKETSAQNAEKIIIRSCRTAVRNRNAVVSLNACDVATKAKKSVHHACQIHGSLGSAVRVLFQPRQSPSRARWRKILTSVRGRSRVSRIWRLVRHLA
jgi:hypothetical protein